MILVCVFFGKQKRALPGNRDNHTEGFQGFWRFFFVFRVFKVFVWHSLTFFPSMVMLRCWIICIYICVKVIILPQWDVLVLRFGVTLEWFRRVHVHLCPYSFWLKASDQSCNLTPFCCHLFIAHMTQPRSVCKKGDWATATSRIALLGERFSKENIQPWLNLTTPRFRLTEPSSGFGQNEVLWIFPQAG